MCWGSAHKRSADRVQTACARLGTDRPCTDRGRGRCRPALGRWAPPPSRRRSRRAASTLASPARRKQAAEATGRPLREMARRARPTMGLGLGLEPGLGRRRRRRRSCGGCWPGLELPVRARRDAHGPARAAPARTGRRGRPAPCSWSRRQRDRGPRLQERPAPLVGRMGGPSRRWSQTRPQPRRVPPAVRLAVARGSVERAAP